MAEEPVGTTAAEPPLPELVQQALAMTDQRLAGLPPGPVQAMLGSIRAQLTYLAQGAATEAPHLTLGVIAVREFEESDPAYCDVLCEVAYRAKRR